MICSYGLLPKRVVKIAAFLIQQRTSQNFEQRTFNILAKIYILRQWKTSLSRLGNTDQLDLRK